MVPILGARRCHGEAARGTDTVGLPSMLSTLSPTRPPGILLPLFSSHACTSLQAFRASPYICPQTPHSLEPGISLALSNAQPSPLFQSPSKPAPFCLITKM